MLAVAGINPGESAGVLLVLTLAKVLGVLLVLTLAKVLGGNPGNVLKGFGMHGKRAYSYAGRDYSPRAGVRVISQQPGTPTSCSKYSQPGVGGVPSARVGWEFLPGQPAQPQGVGRPCPDAMPMPRGWGTPARVGWGAHALMPCHAQGVGGVAFRQACPGPRACGRACACADAPGRSGPGDRLPAPPLQGD